MKGNVSGSHVFTFLCAFESDGWRRTPRRSFSLCMSALRGPVRNCGSSTSTSPTLKVCPAGTYERVLNCGWGCVDRTSTCWWIKESRGGGGLYWHLCCCLSLSCGCDQSERDHPGLGQGDGRAPLQRHWSVHYVSQCISAKNSHLLHVVLCFIHTT